MRVSPRVFSARAHTPLINFLGKRAWPSTPEAQHAHPAAPAELKQSFSEFLKRFQNTSTQVQSTRSGAQSSSSKELRNPNGPVYQEFWEAPTRYWKPRVRELSEEEIDAVLSGGASLN